MRLAITMDEAIELEERVRSCYGLLVKAAQDGAAVELRRLAGEERTHANVLRAGKEFVGRAPEAFDGEMVLGEDIRSGIKAACELEARLKAQKLGLSSGLKLIHDLEKRCERIHTRTALEFRDYSLKKLFETLAWADAEHRQRLKRLIAGP